MLDLSQYTRDTFPVAVDAAIDDPSYVLRVPAMNLVGLATPAQIQQFYKRRDEGSPKVRDYLIDIATSFASPTAVLVKKAFDFNFAQHKLRQHKRAQTLFHDFTIERPFLALDSKEKSVLAAVARLVASQTYSPDQWFAFLLFLAWGNGKGTLVAAAHISGDKDMPFAHQELGQLLQHLHPEAGDYIVKAARDVAVHALQSSADDAPTLFSGARWATTDDLDGHAHFTTERKAPSLFLGPLGPTRQNVYYNGHESLITVAGPGAGKSSALAIPNLLTCPGSVVVLDVKGELWDKTAAFRKANFGPVFRFAPTDPTGASHRFNPFDFVSTEPNAAANDCEVFSQQVIVDRPNDRDPYWEGKGRDYLWAFAFMVAVSGDPSLRNLQAISALLGLSISLDDPDDRQTASRETLDVIEAMNTCADNYGIPDLHHAATSFYDGLGTKRLDSVLDAARRHMGSFNRSASVRHALSGSDWSPLDLRSHPGTSVYICMDDLKAFGAIVRLMVFQHYRLLKNYNATCDEPPITFFLDEMPRLGNFNSILEMQDIGRGAGLRLWMFVQSYGQLVQNFGADRAPGIIDSCRVRTFIEPQHDEMRFVLPALGEKRNIFTGEKEPLATADELQGNKYSGKIITPPRGSRPMVLAPLYAHASPGLTARIQNPPLVP